MNKVDRNAEELKDARDYRATLMRRIAEMETKLTATEKRIGKLTI